MKEAQKMSYDTFKSQNVLSSSALVAFTAITVALIPEPVYLVLLILAYGAIFVSIGSTLLVMHSVPVNLLRAIAAPRLEEEEKDTHSFAYLLSSAGLVASLMFFSYSC